MTEKEEIISEEAKKYIKEKKKELIERFANLHKYPPAEKPESIFMAGSPGAGKTEFSKALIDGLGKPIVRIDADEIRKIIPSYTGNNSHIIHGACCIGVEKLYDHVLHNNQNFILDGTFASYPVSSRNIKNSIKKRRWTEIFFIYQDPLIAWEYTKKREAIEHRNIPKDIFINAFLNSINNVNKAKAEFGNKIILNLIVKNHKHDFQKIEMNIQSLDPYLKKDYDIDKLKKLLN